MIRFALLLAVVGCYVGGQIALRRAGPGHERHVIWPPFNFVITADLPWAIAACAFAVEAYFARGGQ